MTTIQGISPLSATPFQNLPAKSQASAKAPAPKLEIQETAQSERQEALSGKVEVGELAQQGPGSTFSATV